MNASDHPSTARHQTSVKKVQSLVRDQSGIGTASRPHASHSRDKRDSLSTRISPPLLTRKRKGTKGGEIDQGSSDSKPLSDDQSTSLRKTKHRHGESSANEIEPIRHERSSKSLRQSVPYLNPLLQREHAQRENRSRSSGGDSNRSSSLTRTDSRNRWTCRVCEKSSATTYNPIVTCLGCDRPYHDSCRMPPLIDGVDEKYWRCSKCLAPSQRRMQSGSDAAQLSLLVGTGLPSQYVIGVHARTAPQKSPHVAPVSKKCKDRPRQITISTDTGHSDVALGEAPINERPPVSGQNGVSGRTLEHARILQHNIGMISSPPRSESGTSGLHKAHDIANMPTKVPNTHVIIHQVLEQQVSRSTNSVVSSYDHAPPFTNHIRSEKRAALTILCSDCRRQHILVKSGNTGVKCLNCRKKASISAGGRTKVSKTPDVASSYEAQAQTKLPTTKPESIAASPLPIHSVPIPWFRSRFVHLNPTVTQKRLGDHDIEMSRASHAMSPDQESIETQLDSGIREMDQGVTMHSTNHKQSQRTDNSEPATLRFGSKQLKRATSPSNDMFEITEPAATASEEKGSASSVRRLDRRYTNLELAGIAMIATDRPQLTAMDIVDWLASSFAHLDKGNGEWEKSITAALPLHPEFRSEKLQGERVVYSFVDTTIRCEYEKLYHEYCAPPQPYVACSSTSDDGTKSTNNEVVVHKTIKKHRPVKPRAIKSAPTLTSKVSRHAEPKHSATVVQERAETKTLEEEDSLVMPFERRIARLPLDVLDSADHVRRQNNFYNIMPRTHQSLVETMSQAEKAQKITEIKERPPRKCFFGPEHGLAHVRRYKRQDIHDESDGAWHPKVHDREDYALQVNGGRSLKELFNLPKNVIPMIDGMKELAFRDGTLINGRLPRSRQVYRVG